MIPYHEGKTQKHQLEKPAKVNMILKTIIEQSDLKDC